MRYCKHLLRQICKVMVFVGMFFFHHVRRFCTFWSVLSEKHGFKKAQNTPGESQDHEVVEYLAVSNRAASEIACFFIIQNRIIFPVMEMFCFEDNSQYI
jgi:hypothetical protein